MRDRLLESAYLQMDETTVQVLKEPGKTAQATSYLWVQRSGECAQPVVLYDYAPSRAGAVPVALLGTFKGYLQTDGYAGYHAVVAANGLTPLYCFAHARRYFTDALKALGLNPNKLPPKPPDKARRPLKARGFIRQLYAIEQRLRTATPTERGAARQAESVPVLKALRAWLEELLPKVVPSSPLGKALGYLDRHWQGLGVYCADGRLEIDNNLCENALRPFVTGRNYAQCPVMRSPRRSSARRRQPAYSQRHRSRSRLHITMQVCCPVTLNDRTTHEPLQHASSSGSDPIAAQRLACRMRGTLSKVA